MSSSIEESVSLRLQPTLEAMQTSSTVIYSASTMPIEYCLDIVDDHYDKSIGACLEYNPESFAKDVAGVFEFVNKDIEVVYKNEAHVAWYDAVIGYMTQHSKKKRGYYVLCEGGIEKAEQTLCYLGDYHVYDIHEYDIVRLKNGDKNTYMAVVEYGYGQY